jgi:iron complex outermembrane receptor protein
VRVPGGSQTMQSQPGLLKVLTSYRVFVVNRRAPLSVASIVASAFLYSTAAHADETISAAPGESVPAIEEIIVTAQKKPESAQSVPISLSVLSAADIENRDLHSVYSLGTSVPNMQVLLPFGDALPQFSLRGVTETDFSQNQSSPIAMYVDGVYQSVGALQSLQLYDIERVEVLRGPQGTLEGRNSTGGAIQFHSKEPTFDRFASLMVGGGNYGRYEAQGVGQTSVVDDLLAVRFAFTYQNVDGYIKNLYPDAPYGGHLSGVRDLAGRLSFLLTPTPELKMILRLSASRSDPVNYGTYTKDIGPGGAGIPDGFFPGVEPTGFTRAGLSFFQNDSSFVARRNIHNNDVSLTSEYAFSNALKLTAITSYENGLWLSPENDAGTPDAVFNSIYNSRVNTFQQEVRISSAFTGPYDFIAGLTYGHESLFYHTTNYSSTYQPAVVDIEGQDTNLCLLTEFFTCIQNLQFYQNRVDYAGFLSNSLMLTDKIKLTAGARYTYHMISVHGWNTNITYLDPASAQPVAPTIGLIPGVADDPSATAPREQAIDHNWTENVTLNYQATPRNMLYASFATGFRGSAFNAGAFASTSSINAVRPETIHSVEVGSKNQFAADRLQVNLALFHYIYHDQQFSSIDPNSGFSVEYNLPQSTFNGGELEAIAQPTADLRLQVGAGYTAAHYDSGVVNLEDVSGRQVANAPRWSVSGSASWHLFDAWNMRYSLLGSGNGVTQQYYAADNSPYSLQRGYTLANGGLTAESLDRSLKLHLWANNLFNRQYFTTILPGQSFMNASFALRGNPRTYGLQVSYEL